MFNKKKQPAIKSLIAQQCQIDGNFTFADGMRLDGQVHGNLTGDMVRPSILVISESASVTGEVQADHIIINGTVNGPVHARVMLELQPKARIKGDVAYKALEMHQGALVDGHLCPNLEARAQEKPTLKLAANNE
ncbi:polymer-forming cytoskeletal protein [Rhodoferax sp.]|uniref:bactofilin family protein n=1 Tax=Rhodoferax sp. TaxID=50421 RepID=UPI0008D68F8C|nr:polymer-forming cytoskeletal protein [Rhodoferax sp.]OGB59712.1 MAG: cell shape determination protein CcmA [Burkholderiales bacterium RIFOXYD12_FULL_59_19]OGB76073.1 MAG: cell shape determination protein CcmA [Burkholderiales bacterium RIFOXYC12_FULL_60_6]OGB86363.1 MAG: cell shape determination protein CcmA [Burkholderiales bacterium RIFOXYD2_FULL_59_8]MDO8319375.1 polymer-forming cytoskeletal protein [Rhodoferax sp.]MDP2678064.1 polymer-forming cytoskeletal protein [Rhodoferax sp.]